MAWATFNQAAPAWVQAIGSVIAVYIAGRTVLFAAHSARLSKLEGVDAIYHLSASTISDARKAFVGVDANPSEFDVERFEDCLRLLKQLEGALVEIGSELLPSMTTEASRVMKVAKGQFEDAVRSGGPSEVRNSILDLLDANRDKILKLREISRKIVKRQKTLTKRWWWPWSPELRFEV